MGYNIKILHIITGLGQGGAESTMVRLIGMMQSEYTHIVVSLSSEMHYESYLMGMGIKVVSLQMPRGRLEVRGFLQLLELIRAEKPDAIQAWMYHANLVGGVAARLIGCNRVIWGLHNTGLDPTRVKLGTRIVAKICAGLSWFVPRLIVSCSVAARDSHVAMGYSRTKFRIVPNGYDLSVFKRDSEARDRIRRELHIAQDTPLIGIVARWDPVKDHANFLAAAGFVAQQNAQVRFLICGENMTSQNIALRDLISTNDLENRVSLLGMRGDVMHIMAALDVHVLSSSSEAFPNVVGEAMACEVPCVVTDVGDARLIVGGTGWVVPPRNSTALAQAMIMALTKVRSDDGKTCWAARNRIAEQFSIDRMVQDYAEVWKKISGPSAKHPAKAARDKKT